MPENSKSSQTPQKEFTDLKLNKQLLMATQEAGYEKPTPIQAKAIPSILSGHDILGIAQTGTGKTAAFVLPILKKLTYAQGENPRALILTPTRELAIQIDNHIAQLAKYTDLRHVCVFGGTGFKKQIEEIEKGVDILTATPGRLMDIYFREVLILKQLKILVLDEADKMTDMGFMPQVRRLLEIIPTKRQNLLFSATMPNKVVELAHEFLEFPQRIEVTPQATTAETVEQSVYFVPNTRTKINLLMKFLENENFSRVIVFVRTKRNATNIGKYLTRKLTDEVRIIHANKGQNMRINAMNDFKTGTVRVLVATDVSSRGIDIQEVSHVINFDLPRLHEDYVHRIGRTGRAFRTGEAISFCNDAEKYHLRKIQELIRMTITTKDFPDNVEITETPKEERQEMLREIDTQKKKDNPKFKGAFHDKKSKKTSNSKNSRKPKKSSSKSRSSRRRRR